MVDLWTDRTWSGLSKDFVADFADFFVRSDCPWWTVLRTGGFSNDLLVDGSRPRSVPVKSNLMAV